MTQQKNNLHGGFVCDGKSMASVSNILKSDPKLATRNKARAASKHEQQSAKSKFAAKRGIAAHAAMRQYLRTGQVDDLNPQFYPYFENLHNEVSRLDLTNHLWIEGPVTDGLSHLQQGPYAAVWDSKYQYAGCPDYVGYCGGVAVVAELKTTDCLFQDHYTYKDFSTYPSWMKYKHASYQCSAYRNAFTKTTGIQIDAALIITATRDSSQLFILEGDRLDKRLKEFHKLARDYQKIHT